MSQFTPCQGKTACRDDGTRCLTCNRDFNEINRLRGALDQLATLAMEYDYTNSDEYSAYIARKVEKMIAYRRQETGNAT
ncbi:hypothetical protein [Candidatus Albibeggiatoa sp. nov. NOAA]|uniref:hypothetical protein n=1 Tax=Candidatus Albibeggiatoa sp. nov. NOAA TaxID=3162724 RepID=UPI0032F95A44|nr:hypothetical protein [Thiotrichaceae bacterium]